MSPDDPDQRLAAEQRARALIDRQLADAGWSVQDKKDLNLFAAQGIACREVVMKSGHGRADYLLYVDKKVVGVIEAKAQGATLSGVEWQSAMYAEGLRAEVRLKALTVDGKLPFVFEASGSETHFTNGYDPQPRSRQIFSFPQSSTLAKLLRDAAVEPDNPTWRGKLRGLPELDIAPLRPAQITAINGIEQSLLEQRFDRSLVQMATGAGKTFTAVTTSYRLLKFGGFSRILFLVDRNTLAKQTVAEFENYRTPGDGRRFTELYGVDRLRGAGMLGSSNVVISTIQRVHAALRGEAVSAEDDPGLDGYEPSAPVTVAYNADLAPEAFDLIIVDEAHRSIYGVWRGVLEYFDAHIVGLTATPGKQTFAFFKQNLVSEYTYPQAVADGVNVDFDIYRIQTEISQQGSVIESGMVVPTVDRRTREQKYIKLDADVTYTQKQLDRAVTSKSQIRLVLETFRDRLYTEIFPGRSEVPKTLIFAKDDAHAEEIVTAVREVFGKGNDFAAKITYAARDPEGQLKAFRTSPALRVAVTVDMIATGTDVKPLECVFFMRDVRSAQYFEQMKGRGARTMPSADFEAVTPDASTKTRFVIIDAVGVTEHDFVDPPLNRVKGASLKQLLGKAAALELTEDETATLASRLAKLELQLTPEEREELDSVSPLPMRELVRGLVDAVDPDVQAGAIARAENPATAIQALLDAAIEPLAANPALRERIVELRASHDRIIDEISVDTLVDAHGVADTSSAASAIESWLAYLLEHRDEITAIQLTTESKGRRVAFVDIQELADRISRPPYNWTADYLWRAYELVDPGRVRKSDHHTLTDLVSLLRYSVGGDKELVPYAERIQERYAAWLAQQKQAGTVFTEKESWWLDRMVNVIASSVEIRVEDLDEAPFTERGGADGALRDLGDNAGHILESLNQDLTA